MFQYTSTVLINSINDSSGLPKWTAQAEDTSANPVVQGNFNVKRVNKYIKDNVGDGGIIWKREGYNPEYSTVSFTIPASISGTPGLYRIALYLRYSQGNRNSFFANDLVFQGKPLWIEFEVVAGDTPTTVGNKIVAAYNKYKVIWDNKVITLENNAGVVTITAVDEYIFFYKADIEKFQPIEWDCECDAKCQCDFTPVISAKRENQEGYDGTNLITDGRPGFGTFYQISKDLRLPTMEARRYAGINQEELPIPGVLYNQYTFRYVKRRGVLGTNAVGDLVTSGTTHVFFVRQDLATQFEADIANIGTVTLVEDPN